MEQTYRIYLIAVCVFLIWYVVTACLIVMGNRPLNKLFFNCTDKELEIILRD